MRKLGNAFWNFRSFRNFNWTSRVNGNSGRTEICRIFRKTAGSGRTLFDELSFMANGHSSGPEGLPRWFQTRASLITSRGWRRASDSRFDLGTERGGRTTRSTEVASSWTTSPLAFILPPPPPPAVSPVLLNPWREFCDAQALRTACPHRDTCSFFVISSCVKCTRDAILLINNWWYYYTFYLSNENWWHGRIFMYVILSNLLLISLWN